ncbi:hypothetical protein GCM10028791_20410 [Echinicola sediminis]
MKLKIPLSILALVLTLSCTKAQLHITPGQVDVSLVQEGPSPILKGPSALNQDGYFVWGGSVVKGEDGRYHMFYSRWPAGEDHEKFSVGWLIDSEIAYAVSDYPDHGFEFVKVVLRGRAQEGHPEAWDAQSVHNPHIKIFEGKYYLYHTGSRYPGKQPSGSPGAELGRRDLIQQNQQLGVTTFDSIEDLLKGNITRYDSPLLSPRTRVKPNHVLNPSPEGTEALPDNLIVVNPSVVFRPKDGKYLLFFKGNVYSPHWRGVHGVAIGDSPAGPFYPKDKFVFDVKDENGQLASAEDPYVWYHENSQTFFAVFKDFTGKITRDTPGLAMMSSKDGEQWSQLEQGMFMPLKLNLKDGSTVEVKRLERPQLLIDENGLPQVLYAACAVEGPNAKKDGSSFNIQVPLKSKMVK